MHFFPLNKQNSEQCLNELKCTWKFGHFAKFAGVALEDIVYWGDCACILTLMTSRGVIKLATAKLPNVAETILWNNVA